MSSAAAPSASPAVKRGIKPPGYAFRVQLGRLIFLSRWLQMPLYLGLIVVQGLYVYQFLHELWVLTTNVTKYDETKIMLIVLGLIDVVMIANLLVMVIVGGYETFVSRLHLEDHPDQPEWLSHVNAGVLKVKLAMALIGISSIHLLQTFISAGKPVPPHSPTSAVNPQVAMIGAAGEPLPPTDPHAAPGASTVTAPLPGMTAATITAAETVSPQSAMIQVGIHLTFLVSALALAWADRLTTRQHGGNGHGSASGRHAREDDDPTESPEAG